MAPLDFSWAIAKYIFCAIAQIDWVF